MMDVITETKTISDGLSEYEQSLDISQPMPDEPKPILRSENDDALTKVLNDYFIKMKKEGWVVWFDFSVLERPSEFLYDYIRASVTFEYYGIQKKTSSFDATFPVLDRLVINLGNEKISNQVTISQVVNCARILEYLKSPEFFEKGIEGVDDFILLVEERKKGNIDLDKFSSDATAYIQQIRQQIPEHSLAWLLLDNIAICVALIIAPIAIANGLYHTIREGNFRLGFFDTQTPENKHINHIEAIFDQRQSPVSA